MADFGKAGKLTLRKDELEVHVEDGQYLKLSLSVLGARAIFTYSCEHKPRAREKDFPDHPCALYEWRWNCPQDADAAGEDMYGTRMIFLTATAYSYKITHFASDGTQISRVKDLDASSKDSQDKYSSTLRIIRK